MRGGRLIRTARLRGGLTQQELARRLGTKQPVVARWETGESEPGFDTVTRAVRACGFEPQVRLVPVDDSDDRSIAMMLQLSPQQRLAANRALLELERSAREARIVEE